MMRRIHCVLLAGLLLAAPAIVQAAPLVENQQVGSAGLFARGLAIEELWTALVAAEGDGGGMIDPNGATAGTNGSGDGGGMIDPNG